MRPYTIAIVVNVLSVICLSGCRTGGTSETPESFRTTDGESAGFASPPATKHERLRRALEGLDSSSGLVEVGEQAARRIPGRGDEALARQRCREAAELLEQNARVSAIESYRDALLMVPDLATAHYGLGRALLTKGKTEFAIAAFRTALGINPEYTDARFHLGFALEMDGRRPEAITEYGRLLGTDPSYPGIHARLACALYYVGDLEGAKASFRTAANTDLPAPPQLEPLLKQRKPSAAQVLVMADPQIGEQIRIDLTGGTYPVNETSIAVSEANPQHIVAGWNDFRETVAYDVSRVGVGLSLDGGETWTDFLLRPPPGHYGGNEGDPMTAADPHTGDLWVGGISWGPYGGVFVARKRPDASTFDEPVMAREYYFTDKCWMAAGRAPDDPDTTRLYITFDQGVIISTDMGATWTDPQSLGNGHGFLPRIGPNGELYVVYWDFADGVMLRRSFDGGLTFDPPIRIATRLDVWTAGDGSRFPGLFRVPPFSYLAVDPNDGTLYVVYFDTTEIVGGRYNVDVYMAKSTDQGTSWSTPVVINGDADPPGDQFFCWLEADRNGRLHLHFYDTRHTDQPDGDTHGWIDAYYSTSTDGGGSWAEYRLTPEPFDSADIGLITMGQFLGDYNGLAATNTHAYPCYPSTQNGDADIFINVISFPEIGGDLDGDGDVDLADLAILLADYECTGGDCPGDADGDGDTDLADLAILLAHYGYGT